MEEEISKRAQWEICGDWASMVSKSWWTIQITECHGSPYSARVRFQAISLITRQQYSVIPLLFSVESLITTMLKKHMSLTLTNSFGARWYRLEVSHNQEMIIHSARLMTPPSLFSVVSFKEQELTRHSFARETERPLSGPKLVARAQFNHAPEHLIHAVITMVNATSLEDKMITTKNCSTCGSWILLLRLSRSSSCHLAHSTHQEEVVIAQIFSMVRCTFSVVSSR